MRLVEKLIVKSLQFYWRQSRGLALGVQAIVQDGTGRVLLVRESPAAAWSLPSTTVRPDEAAPMAVVRMLSDLATTEAGTGASAEASIEIPPPNDLRLIDHDTSRKPNLHIAVYALQLEASTAISRTGRANFFTPAELPALLQGADLRRLSHALADATR